MISFFVPGALRNPLNGSLSRAHWSRKSREANLWKTRTLVALMLERIALPPAELRTPKRITFLAQTGAPWDDDEGINAACKPIRDALIGRVIHSDALDSGHVFVYRQTVNRTQRGVRVTVEPREQRSDPHGLPHVVVCAHPAHRHLIGNRRVGAGPGAAESRPHPQ